MATFKISEPNKKVKWVKDVNEHDGILTFTENRNEGYQRSSGIIANSTLQYLKFHFGEEYPEMEYCTVDCGGYY
jgi:hypothetical protein